MIPARLSVLRGVSALPFGGGVGGMAVLASPRVRAIAAEWVRSSQGYFAAMQRWSETHNDAPTRQEVERDCDVAILEDEAVRRRIIDLPSTELGAVALKAAAFLVQQPGFEDVDQAIGDVVADEGPSSEALALAIARDMAGIFGAPVEALAAVAKRAGAT